MAKRHLRKLNESTSQGDTYQRKRKWATPKKNQRQKKSVGAESTDHRACESHVKKRQCDMSPGEKREEYRSRQKVTYDRITDTGRKADERTMCTDQTHVNLMHVDETPLRTRQSTSRFTVYRTVNLIKEHLSESPGPYADKVDKLTTPTTTKYALNWNVVYLNGSSTMRTIKLIIEDAKQMLILETVEVLVVWFYPVCG